MFPSPGIAWQENRDFVINDFKVNLNTLTKKKHRNAHVPCVCRYGNTQVAFLRIASCILVTISVTI